MNYRAIAVQVGDLLKYDTTLNEVSRVASAVFRFKRQAFPNAAVTSVRAQLVHDWVLTLATQQMTEGERNKLLVQFVHGITPSDKRVQVDQILQDNGIPRAAVNPEPVSALMARDLHPEVIEHAQKLFVQGNYFHALFEVAKAYNKKVREKAQSAKDGEALMLDVWGCEKGVLKVTPCVSETDKNVQDGIKFLSAGLMRAIRNPTAHEPALDWPISRADCLDMLSFTSFLFRRLEDAVYSRPRPSAAEGS